MGETKFIFVDGEHGFGYGHLHDIDPAARHMNGKQPHPHAQACAGGQHGSPHFAIAAGNKEGVAIGAFVAFGLTANQEIGQHRLIDYISIIIYGNHNKK